MIDFFYMSKYNNYYTTPFKTYMSRVLGFDAGRCACRDNDKTWNFNSQQLKKESAAWFSGLMDVCVLLLCWVDLSEALDLPLRVDASDMTLAITGVGSPTEAKIKT